MRSIGRTEAGVATCKDRVLVVDQQLAMTERVCGELSIDVSADTVQHHAFKHLLSNRLSELILDN